MTDATTKAKHTESTIRDGYDTARAKASDAIHSSRDAASDAAKRTVQSLEANPLGILVGGLAVGVLAGALLPRSTRERELLAPLGKRIGETARAATAAAKDAGRSELANLGLTKDAARDQARGLFDGVVRAITTAGTAAAKSASQKQHD